MSALRVLTHFTALAGAQPLGTRSSLHLIAAAATGNGLFIYLFTPLKTSRRWHADGTGLQRVLETGGAFAAYVKEKPC